MPYTSRILEALVVCQEAFYGQRMVWITSNRLALLRWASASSGLTHSVYLAVVFWPPLGCGLTASTTERNRCRVWLMLLGHNLTLQQALLAVKAKLSK